MNWQTLKADTTYLGPGKWDLVIWTFRAFSPTKCWYTFSSAATVHHGNNMKFLLCFRFDFVLSSDTVIYGAWGTYYLLSVIISVEHITPFSIMAIDMLHASFHVNGLKCYNAHNWFTLFLVRLWGTIYQWVWPSQWLHCIWQPESAMLFHRMWIISQ